MRLVLTVAVPCVLVLSNVRIVLLPWFTSFEYSRLNFPRDVYGLTGEERKSYALSAVEYLVNDVGIEFLTEQRFDDGTELYNERELRHMEDVKAVIHVVMWVWRISTLLALFAMVGLYLDIEARPMLGVALSTGAAIVVAIFAVLVLYVLINFDGFFTNFHRLLFESGTWTFSYSDTLIRLFPLQFWSDVAILIGGVSLLEGLLLLWCARLI